MARVSVSRKPILTSISAEVTSYARSKGVSLIGHNETAGAIANYESQMAAGFAQYAKYGVHTVKTAM